MVKRWSIEFMEAARDDLRDLDSVVAQRIMTKLRWMTENFESLVPEPLSGAWKGSYKLRVGDWRVVYTTESSVRMITIHLVAHRSHIYRMR